MTDNKDKSQLDELNELVPWMKVTRESIPHPADAKRTMYRYHLHDTSANRRVCTLVHSCHMKLVALVAHTLVAVKEFGVELVSFPEHYRLELDKFNDSEGTTYVVALIDKSTHQCILHLEADDALEAVRKFWQHPELALSVAQAAPEGAA